MRLRHPVCPNLLGVRDTIRSVFPASAASPLTDVPQIGKTSRPRNAPSASKSSCANFSVCLLPSNLHLAGPDSPSASTADLAADTFLIVVPVRLLHRIALARPLKARLIIVFGAAALTSLVSLIHATFLLRGHSDQSIVAAIVEVRPIPRCVAPAESVSLNWDAGLRVAHRVQPRRRRARVVAPVCRGHGPRARVQALHGPYGRGYGHARPAGIQRPRFCIRRGNDR